MDIVIRPFEAQDAAPVRALFIVANRLLAPPGMELAFEAYVERALAEEMDRVAEYYGERGGGFWVAARDGAVIGMFGLEPAGPDALELRRMYVDPAVRRGGVASLMLRFAEDACRRRAKRRLVLSTSELQPAAIGLYLRAGYQLLEEVVAQDASNKTIGGGIRRFLFEKAL